MRASEAAKHSNCIVYPRCGCVPQFFFRCFSNALWFNIATQERYTTDELENFFYSSEWEPWCRKEVEPEPEPSDPTLIYGSDNVCVTEYKKPIDVHVALKDGLQQGITNATMKVENSDKKTITWSNATESLCVNEDCIQFIKTWES